MTRPSAYLRPALFAMLAIAAGATVACSTTRYEAPRPAQVTVVAPTQWAAPSQLGDIGSVAASSGQFATLLRAVNAAGLGSTLSGAGPITVFAPTDAAFARLPYGTLDRLLQPENQGALRQVILYHVLNGRMDSVGLMGKMMASPTLEGLNINIDGRNGVMINNARVLQPDIEASNGLIHSIDTVLIPSNMLTLR